LQKEIDYYQQAVVRARQQMQYEEQRLTDKNIEVKKYEKLKSREYDKYLDLLNYEDAKVMDEISTQAISRGRFKSQ
jgi:flagellar FliJ protein